MTGLAVPHCHILEGRDFPEMQRIPRLCDGYLCFLLVVAWAVIGLPMSAVVFWNHYSIESDWTAAICQFKHPTTKIDCQFNYPAHCSIWTMADLLEGEQMRCYVNVRHPPPPTALNLQTESQMTDWLATNLQNPFTPCLVDRDCITAVTRAIELKVWWFAAVTSILCWLVILYLSIGHLRACLGRCAVVQNSSEKRAILKN
jgi:hypothetical protein